MSTPGPTVTRWEYLTAPLLMHNTEAILDNCGRCAELARAIEIVVSVEHRSANGDK